MSLPAEITFPGCALTRILNHPENFTDYAQSILFTLRVAVARTTQINLPRDGREEEGGRNIDRFIYARLGSNDRIRSLCRREDSQSARSKTRAFHLKKKNRTWFICQRYSGFLKIFLLKSIDMKIESSGAAKRMWRENTSTFLMTFKRRIDDRRWLGSPRVSHPQINIDRGVK